MKEFIFEIDRVERFEVTIEAENYEAAMEEWEEFIVDDFGDPLGVEINYSIREMFPIPYILTEKGKEATK